MRRLLRAPALLYHRNLGRLLGRRLLLLTHVGRRSGRRYGTVLEVIGPRPEAREFMVLAGLGRSAHWYKNLRARPTIEVAVGRQRFQPVHRELGEDQAAAVLRAYERRNRLAAPIVRLVLSRLLGWRYDGSDNRAAAPRPRTAGRRVPARRS